MSKTADFLATDPLDLFDELKKAGPRDEYDRMILEMPSIHSLTVMSAMLRERDLTIRELEEERVRMAWQLIKMVGAGPWSKYVDQGELGREILAELAEEEDFKI